MSDQSHRPVHVIERDRAVVIKLTEGPQSLRTLGEVLGLSGPAAYRAVYRLRKRGLVDKSRDGSRTPTWTLTEAGVAYASAPPETPMPGEVPLPPPVPEVAPPA